MMFIRMQQSSWSTIMVLCYIVGGIVSITGLLRGFFNLRIAQATDEVSSKTGMDPFSGYQKEERDEGFYTGDNESSDNNIDYDNVIEAEIEDYKEDEK